MLMLAVSFSAALGAAGPAPVSASLQDQVVCRTWVKLGSRLGEKTCLTRREWARRAAEAEAQRRLANRENTLAWRVPQGPGRGPGVR